MIQMFTVIKMWLGQHFLPILLIVGSALVFSLVGVSYLYSQKIESYNELAKANDSVVKELGGLRVQLEEERIRHQELEERQRQTYQDFLSRQEKLNAMKNDKKKKEEIKKNVEQYELEVQKNLNDYTKRMNCLSGNSASCSRI